MIECANCGKKLRENFTYCRICGTKLDGGMPGDYSTGILNVFKKDGGYMYLFSENGNQVILDAGSLDELAVMVKDRKYPWEFSEDKSESDFSPADSLSDFDTFSNDSEREENESYVPEYVVERVME